MLPEAGVGAAEILTPRNDVKFTTGPPSLPQDEALKVKMSIDTAGSYVAESEQAERLRARPTAA